MPENHNRPPTDTTIIKSLRRRVISTRILSRKWDTGPRRTLLAKNAPYLLIRRRLRWLTLFALFLMHSLVLTYALPPLIQVPLALLILLPLISVERSNPENNS